MITLKDDKPNLMIENGKLQVESFSDTPYVFQNIHTLGHKARYTAEHLVQLNRSAKELFGEQLPTNITAKQIEQQIEELLATNRFTRNTSIRVEIHLSAIGDYSLRCYEPSLYAGYVLRSLRPEAICLPIDMPLPQHPTSASAATRLLADAIARQNGYHTAIIAERDGGVAIEPCAPLFYIKEYTMFAQEGYHSVESNLTIAAAHAIGLTIERKRLMTSDLKYADEVFSANWQGITAIAHIGQQPYMSILAEKIAHQMERAAQKQ